MANSRAKGNGYERELCRLFSKWWKAEEFKGVPADKLPFRRTPGSGAWEKGGADVKPVTEADMARWPFCIEAKKREAWDWYTFIEGAPEHPIWKWWEQCSTNAQKVGKLPLLVFTRNNRPSYMMLEASAAERYGIFEGFVVVRAGEESLVIALLEKLFDLDPKTVVSGA